MTTKSPTMEDVEKSADDVEKQAPVNNEPPRTGPPGPPNVEYPSFKKAFVIMIAVYLAAFLVALDRTIIATAIPRITDDFHSLGDVGWYGSAYLITLCSFQLIFGKIYTFYSIKKVFLATMFLFEVGSAICGAAPNSVALIIGRAIAGLGSSGIMSGGIVIIVNTIPLHKRPIYMGMMGMVFGVASLMGPLVGGAFTTHVSWRWCFYINLPIGGVVMAVVTFILKAPSPHKKDKGTIIAHLKKLDPLGSLFFLPGMICLLLALEWGGSTYSWKNGRIIALLVLFVLFFASFIFIQIWKTDTATVPVRILKQRSIAFGFMYAICTGSTMMVMVYFLPIWFQAIKGASAVKSGIMNLPLILSLVIGSMSAGFLVSRVGYYVPFLIASSILMPIGAGLISTFKVDTNHSAWFGYQVLMGFGIGIGMQQASLAAQTVLSGRDVPIGISLMILGQNLGGAISLSIGQNVFSNRLIANLANIPGIAMDRIVDTGATELRNVVNPKYLSDVLLAYNGAITDTFYVAVAFASVSAIASCSIEWKNVKKESKKGGH